MTTCQSLNQVPSFLPTGMSVCCFPNMEAIDTPPELFHSDGRVMAIKNNHATGSHSGACKDCLAVNELTGFRQVTSKNPREVISIANSSKCNKACRMCKPELSTTLSALEGQSSKPITNKYLKGYLERYGKEIKTILVSGGNPMQDKELWDMLAPLSTTADILIVTTNGSGVSDYVYDVLHRFDRAHVCISLDGDKYYNESMRHYTKQSAVYATINQVLEQGLPVYVQMTKTNLSVARYRELYDEIVHHVPLYRKVRLSTNVCFYPEIYAPWCMSQPSRDYVRNKLAEDVVYLRNMGTPLASDMVNDILLAEKLIRMKPVSKKLLSEFKQETIRFDSLISGNLIDIQNVC